MADPYALDQPHHPNHARYSSRHMRLSTLTKLRWLAIFGQSVAVCVVALGFQFDMPTLACFALIACSAALNVSLSLRFPASHRLKPWPALLVFCFDVAQLAALLFLTGGLQNPFAILMIVPVVISSSAQPAWFTLVLAVFASLMITLLAFFHLPLPWFAGQVLVQPNLILGGSLLAILLTMSFAAIYAWRVSREAQLLSNALASTELVLQREQHLTAIDGIAAAAAHELGTPLATIHVVLKELENALGRGPLDMETLSEDITLLRSQSARCRDILSRLRSLSDEGVDHIGQLKLTTLIEEAIAPYRGPDINLNAEAKECIGPEPVAMRRPGVVHGIGNIVENASDFARQSVSIEWQWNTERVIITITDDGPGFSPSVLDHVGEPYVSERLSTQDGLDHQNMAGGLGLGLFIARTLLERSGAQVSFNNSPLTGSGAVVTIIWSRFDFEKPIPEELS